MTRSPSGGGDGARGRRITASPTNDTDFLDPSRRPASYHVSYCSCEKRNLEKQEKKREKYCRLTSNLRRQIHQSVNLGPIERSQHDDRTIVFLAPWKTELLDGFLVDKSAGESGAATASDVGAGITGLGIQVLDVVVVPGVAGAGPVMASGERPVTVARGGRGNHHVVRVAVVESVLPDWRGTGRGIGESRGVVDDQWPH